MSRKKKKIKYKPITFKLSDRQKKSLEAYCRRNNTTINKYIKNSIKEALKDGRKPSSSIPQVSKGQMDLEDLIDQVTRENENGKSLKLPFPDDLIGK
jgi:hypothetical protein